MSVLKRRSGIELIAYRDELRANFELLNREWIEKYFTVEEADRAVFADPPGKIVAPGGQIFFVLEDGEAKGTCAVLRRTAETYELAKMAVTASARGKGFGDLLMRAAIDFARGAGAKEMVLCSNTNLGTAMRLYEKYGFCEIPLIPDKRYHRVDIMMRLDLRQKPRPVGSVPLGE